MLCKLLCKREFRVRESPPHKHNHMKQRERKNLVVQQSPKYYAHDTNRPPAHVPALQQRALVHNAPCIHNLLTMHYNTEIHPINTSVHRYVIQAYCSQLHQILLSHSTVCLNSTNTAPHSTYTSHTTHPDKTNACILQTSTHLCFLRA